jgi:hypothetical protein
MPNYCHNTLTIKGNPETTKQIMEFVKSEDNPFDFDKIVPMPDYIYRGNLGNDERKLYGKNNWYDWSIENWGTKWNCIRAVTQSNTIYFDTAYTPSSPVIAALAQKYHTMRFEYSYYEMMMGFQGEETYENGELISYDYGELEFDED